MKAWAGTNMIRNCFVGTERFFRPGYVANLISTLDTGAGGRERKKLAQAATVADVGCGLGASTILMAKSYPKSTFFGFDYHEKSIETAVSKGPSRLVSATAFNSRWLRPKTIPERIMTL